MSVFGLLLRFFSFCFHSLTLTFLGVVFFVFVLLCGYWVFWICKSMSLTNIEKFQPYFSRYFFLPHFHSLLFLGLLLHVFWLFDIILKIPELLFIFLQSLYFLQVISIDLSSSLLYFCLQHLILNLSIQSILKFSCTFQFSAFLNSFNVRFEVSYFFTH